MARIRTIKPDFFKNEELADLPLAARMLFVGLWTLADRRGRLLDRPKRIRAEIFPYDEVDVCSMLSMLDEGGFIIRYSVGEISLIQVVSFEKHQRITGSEAASESEFPDVSQRSVEDESGNNLESTKTTGREGKGKGKERKEAAAADEIDSLSANQSKQPIGSDSGNAPPLRVSPPMEIKMPWGSEAFREKWEQWKAYKKAEHRFGFKSPQSEQASLIELSELAGGIEAVAIKIITQSLSKGWKGLFQLKHDEQRNHTSGKPATGASVNSSSAFTKIAGLFGGDGG